MLWALGLKILHISYIYLNIRKYRKDIVGALERPPKKCFKDNEEHQKGHHGC